MEDDQQKGLLLALALSMLVIVGWSFVMRQLHPAPQEPQQTEAPQSTAVGGAESAPAPAAPTAPAAVETPAPAAAPPAPAPLPPPVVDEKVVETEIRTDVLHLKFTSRGGLLTSAKLPLFASKSEGVVEMIPSDQGETPESHPLGVESPQLDGLDDRVFATEHIEPGSAEHAALMQAIDQALQITPNAQGEGYVLGFAPSALTTDALRTEIGQALRAAGVGAVKAAVLGPALADVPVDSEGAPVAAWKQEIAANRNNLASSHLVDYSLPLGGGAVLHKVYVVSGKHYEFDMTLVLDNRAASSPVSLGGKSGYQLEWGPGLESSERNARLDRLETIYLYKKSFKKKTLTNGFLKRNMGPDGLPKPVEPPADATWFGLRRKYFLMAVYPTVAPTAARFVALTEPKVGKLEMQLTQPPLTAAAGGVSANRFIVALGPIHRAELEAIGHDFDLAVNYGFFDLFGKGMVAGLLFFNAMVRNYGIAIIVLTVLVRLGLFPLNQRSYQSMRAMNMLQPKIQEIREQYKNNPQELNKRTMALYSEYKINPLGGCLPMLFQMPVFFALFNALRSSLELRGAQFLWIKDLSEPDALASLPGGLTLNLLPVLMMGAMLAQQRMSTPPANPNNDPNVEMQRKMMTWMPLMFGFMFYGMPSGLTLYWLVSTLLGIGQQYYINKG